MKTRVASKFVQKALREMGAGLKSNIHAYKVKCDSKEEFFETARRAHNYAVKMAQCGKQAMVFENLGNGAWVDLATYHPEFTSQNFVAV